MAVVNSRYAIFIVALPWLLISFGVALHGFHFGIDSYLYFFSLILLVVGTVAIGVLSKGVFKFDVPSSTSRGFALTKIFCLSWLLFFTTKSLLAINSLYGFSDTAFDAIRVAYFFDERMIDEVYFGSKLIRSIDRLIIGPLIFICVIRELLLAKGRPWLTVLYIVSGVLFGGRFAIYYLFILLIIIGRPISWRVIVVVVGFIFFVSLVRFGVTLDSVHHVFMQTILGYHFAQEFLIFEQMAFSSEFPLMFSGLVTPVSMVLGVRPAEADYLAYTNDIWVSLPGDYGPYNSFVTSAGMVVSDIGLPGVLLYSAIHLVLVTVAVISVKRYPVFSIFLLWSLYFSAFQPIVLTTSWWVGIFMSFLTSIKISRN